MYSITSNLRVFMILFSWITIILCKFDIFLNISNLCILKINYSRLLAMFCFLLIYTCKSNKANITATLLHYQGSTILFII
jgi:hypothetical protein